MQGVATIVLVTITFWYAKTTRSYAHTTDLVLKREIALEAARDLEKARDRAQLVTLQPCSFGRRVSDQVEEFGLKLSNGSPYPIYDVLLNAGWRGQGNATPAVRVVAVLPTTNRYQRWKFEELMVAPVSVDDWQGSLVYEVQFSDASGRRWWRKPDSSLELLEPAV